MSSLADVAFLTRSPNRVAVLSVLADGPHARHELVAETPASRVTVGRIVADFLERGWITRIDGGYELSTTGRLLANELGALRRRLQAIDRLEPVLPWFAVDRLDVPLEAFADARVTVPTPAEPNRHHRRIGTVGAEASEARMYAGGVTREAAEIHRSAVETDGQSLELVLSREALDAARESGVLRETLGDLVSGAFVAVVDEPLSLPFLARFDAVAFLGVADDGWPMGVVESDDERVLAWAARTLDDVVSRARRVGSDLFTG